MRLLLLTHCYPSNSSDIRGSFFLELVSSLRSHGVEIQILTPSWNDENEMNYRVNSNGAQIITFPWSGRYLGEIALLNPFNWIQIVKFFFHWKKSLEVLLDKGEGWDLVIAAWGFPAGLLFNLSILSPYKKVIWWLGTDVHKFNTTLLRPVMKHVASRANENWSSAKNLGKILERVIKSDVIFAPLVASNEISKQQNASNSKFVVVSIGRLHPIKGFDVAIDAIKILLREGVDLEYRIIGDGPDRDKLIKKCCEYNKNIKFLGHLEHDAALYELLAANCLLISSRAEALPVVFFEALHAKTRVVSTDVGDVELCLNGTELGVVSANDDSVSLASAIRTFFAMKSRFSAEQAKRILKEYSVKRTVGIINERMTSAEQGRL